MHTKLTNGWAVCSKCRQNNPAAIAAVADRNSGAQVLKINLFASKSSIFFSKIMRKMIIDIDIAIFRKISIEAIPHAYWENQKMNTKESVIADKII